MATIPFTFRELRNAYTLTYNGWNVVNRTNAHRLLLFYSVECGLKAVYLKRCKLNIFSSTSVSEKMFSHDINHLLEELRAGKALRLRPDFELPELNIKKLPTARKYPSSTLNQAWRYGGKLVNGCSDEAFEVQLQKISEWIQGELR